MRKEIYGDKFSPIIAHTFLFLPSNNDVNYYPSKINNDANYGRIMIAPRESGSARWKGRRTKKVK